jgi:predicted MFS family arabinose efflux permease
MMSTPPPTPRVKSTNLLSHWDTDYEWKAVALLSLGFGLVGLDRFIILPMFPVIMKDLNLNYQELGQITGILSVAWGISALFMGRLSDRIGRRKVVVSAMVVFSLLVGISGLASGLGMLLVVRAIMGLADGAYTPPSIIATLEASKPTRHGLNLGIQQMMLPFFGLGLAPIFVTQMLQILDWRWIFVLVTPPGLIVAFFLYRVLRTPSDAEEGLHTATHDISEHKWTDIFQYRNVPLNMIGMLCWLTCLIVTSALLPNYLADYLRLTLSQMGFVLSAIGFGASAGTLIMPAISDRIGRKPVMIISTVGAFVSLILLTRTGAELGTLFAFLFATHFFNFALITLTVGPLSAEAVPAKLMATASGAVICVGEIFGGGIAPVFAGYVAHHFGIQYILQLATVAIGFGIVVALCLKETAPSRTAVPVSH